MKELSDSFLISAYRGGCEASLARLIQRHQKPLFSFIYYKILDEDLANDIFQDTFVKIITTLKEGRYTDEGKFIVWAKRIAHNLIMDHYRRKSKHGTLSRFTCENEDFSIFDLLRESSESAEDQMISRQIYKDLHLMLGHLPASQQEVLRLRFFDGLSFREIAEHTGTSINTTLGRMRYALINLRKIRDENKIILSRT